MLRLLTLFVLSTVAALAQAPAGHTVTLTITDAANPAGTTYNIYRQTGTCTGSAPISIPAIATGVADKSYIDSTVTVGPYCYAVTAVFSGVESPQSNQVSVVVSPFAPNLTVTVK